MEASTIIPAATGKLAATADDQLRLEGVETHQPLGLTHAQRSIVTSNRFPCLTLLSRLGGNAKRARLHHKRRWNMPLQRVRFCSTRRRPANLNARVVFTNG